MTITPRIARPLGTMVIYGFAPNDLVGDLALASQLGATCVEILPLWKNLPDPLVLHQIISDHGFITHSAHGSWGGQSIKAPRVDLASTDPVTRQTSIEDIQRCIDWLVLAGGKHLVIHPGGLSDPDEIEDRTHHLVDSLHILADFVSGSQITLCVENMPPGVHPGSSMADLYALVIGLNRPQIALALDTGHANMVTSVAIETDSASHLLKTTHVHDNNGRHDVHLPPGHGTVDWEAWVKALDRNDYRGPIMLECIQYIRRNPTCITPSFLDLLHSIANPA